MRLEHFDCYFEMYDFLKNPKTIDYEMPISIYCMDKFFSCFYDGFGSYRVYKEWELSRYYNKSNITVNGIRIRSLKKYWNKSSNILNTRHLKRIRK